MLRTVVIAKSFYGFKAHVEITYDGYIINYVITKASVHDAVEALELITSSPYYQLLVDVGYVGKDLHDFLKKQGFYLWIPYRSNMKGTKERNS